MGRVAGRRRDDGLSHALWLVRYSGACHAQDRVVASADGRPAGTPVWDRHQPRVNELQPTEQLTDLL
jgi:hypothetical protein